MSQVTSGPLRRLAATASLATACLAAAGSLSAAPTAAYAGSAPAAAGSARIMPPPLRDEDRADGDRLTVTVRGAGGAADGTYELRCHPDGGSHPDPQGACLAVERNTRWGTETFAPVPEDSICTLQYGGPATARVTGTWAGRPVDATFDRGDGCRIARWDRFVPLLPDLRR
ncbi:SSI family serine proteinase inhibitor [Streptomyces sp. NPDC059378]|uniref:SSI family serine proteinase inhibitor n=1 Tax=Streptomyces sp. NPDC059378 TaxID=3346815 RepID=UPI003696DBA0